MPTDRTNQPDSTNNWSDAKRSSWQQLETLAQLQLKNPVQISSLIKDPDHCHRLSLNIESIVAEKEQIAPSPALVRGDLSKHGINLPVFEALISLAKNSNLEKKIKQLLSGENVNFTEKRAALHTRLRSALVEQDSEITTVYDRMEKLAEKVWADSYHHIIHVGIGGSDLGPRMLVEALEEKHINPSCQFHFISNIDPLEINRVLRKCDPKKTLLVICSKSFSTIETLENAKTLFAWLGDKSVVRKQVIAVTNNVPAAQVFGIDPDNILPMWDWVGGRYSIWSTIGFTLLLAIGVEQFNQFRRGGLATDQHFAQQPLEQNLPVIMALLGIWYNNFIGVNSHGVIPYDHTLERLPSYLQQLDMESNGKQTDRWQQLVTYNTGPIIWGGCGTNSQHSFHQLLHQGTHVLPIDLLLPLTTTLDNEQHRHPNLTSKACRSAYLQLVANCLAQSEAFVYGQQNSSEPHRSIPGNRPHSLLCYQGSDAESLGALIALYEHKTFCQGAIWEINSFDQWGVELGKKLAGPIYQMLETGQAGSFDVSNPTQRIIEQLDSKN